MTQPTHAVEQRHRLSSAGLATGTFGLLGRHAIEQRRQRRQRSAASDGTAMSNAEAHRNVSSRSRPNARSRSRLPQERPHRAKAQSASAGPTLPSVWPPWRTTATTAWLRSPSPLLGPEGAGVGGGAGFGCGGAATAIGGAEQDGSAGEGAGFGCGVRAATGGATASEPTWQARAGRHQADPHRRGRGRGFRHASGSWRRRRGSRDDRCGGLRSRGCRRSRFG